jgi:hypothetical protein
MHSSISASDCDAHQRVVPHASWNLIFVLTVLIEVAAWTIWESYWRAHHFVPNDFEDTPALWQMQRERATGSATVLIGSSRMWQDVDLTAWQEVTGSRPIQLAVAGKNPRPVLRDLANDRAFHGLVLCGVTPYLFFVESELPMRELMERGRTQTLSERASNRIGLVLERWLAAIDQETRLSTLWNNVPLPLRPGAFPIRVVGKGHEMLADRSAKMWSRLEQDPAYTEKFRGFWLFLAGGPQPSLEEVPPSAATAYLGLASIVEIVAAQVAADVEKIRARGGDVAFIRFPSDGPVYASESRSFPRWLAWEPFLAKTQTTGIHFADHDELRGFRLPEWSHMAAEDSEVFTRRLAPLVSKTVATRTGGMLLEKPRVPASGSSRPLLNDVANAERGRQ